MYGGGRLPTAHVPVCARPTRSSCYAPAEQDDLVGELHLREPVEPIARPFQLWLLQRHCGEPQGYGERRAK